MSNKIYMLKNNKPTLITLSDGVVLMPGLNKIDGKILAKESFKKSAKLFIEHSIVEVIEYDAEGEGESKSLKDFKAKDAIEVVRGTFDVEKLAEWSDVETREGVKKAIKKQLADIDKTMEGSDK